MRVNRIRLGGPGDEELVSEFFQHGEGDGKATWPFGVAVGNDGRVYCSDEWTNTISVFDPNGKFQFKFGETGSGDGQLMRPAGIAVEREDGDGAAALAARCFPHWCDEVDRGVAAGTCYAARDSSETIGFACHSVNRAGWIGPMAYLLITEGALAHRSTTPWVWPTRLPGDRGGAICAGLVIAAGLALITVRGPRESGRDSGPAD